MRAFRSSEDLDRTGWGALRRVIVGRGHEATLSQPMGVAVSDDGERVYVADYGLGRLVRADLRRKTVELLGPDEAPPKVVHAALDGEENVYASDTSAAQVIVLSRKGKRLRVIGAGELERPTGLAIDRARGVLYVADSAHVRSPNHRVRAFTLDGRHLFDLGPAAGPAAPGSGDGQLHFPGYLAVSPEGEVYVADAMNFRIQVFGPDGKFRRKYGQAGTGAGASIGSRGSRSTASGTSRRRWGHSNVRSSTAPSSRSCSSAATRRSRVLRRPERDRDPPGRTGSTSATVHRPDQRLRAHQHEARGLGPPRAGVRGRGSEERAPAGR